MRLLSSKSLLFQAKIVFKTLVILLLSALLLAPKPALALNYNSAIQSYVSNVKVELDSVLTAIQKLPNLSYENGKTTLSEIDNKLQKIQIDARQNAVKYGNFSDESQREYENRLDRIYQLQEEQANQGYNENRTLEYEFFSRNPITRDISIFGDNKYVYFFDFVTNHCEANKPVPQTKAAYIYLTFLPCVERLVGSDNEDNLKNFKEAMKLYYIIDRIYQVAVYKGCKTDLNAKEFMNCAVPALDQATTGGPNLANSGTYYIQAAGAITRKPETIRFLEAYYIEKSLRTLRIETPVLQKAIVLTNKISQLSDHLEKRINLATQKAGNVKEYGDALKSFSDPDILGEISEFNEMVANLTTNL
ncbi:hypothetical protein PA905_21190 [Planktothrix agardhii CCAP 1459/11A]|uniref:Uncharacterized protein n=2 Tax=Planktothrix agardhii TaxID=1160 RepID=A0A4P5ZDN9_PLAAG|nr:hypothetical protein PA905_21190 [Planktothrix agardhii CCAP 1459/11A]